MKDRSGKIRLGTLLLIMGMLIACGISPTLGQATSTPVSSTGGSNGGDNPAGGTQNNPLHRVTPLASLTPPPSSTPSPTPTRDLTPDVSGGPYLVKQTSTLGDETLGTPPGGVCLNVPWSVPVSTPKIQFLMAFDPHGAYPGLNGNTVGYSYSFPSLGETHKAQGSYTLASPKSDGTITVSVNIKDHVVFKGFDGNMPIRYQFDLVPMHSGATCHT